jgi:hypothetical protein
MKYVFIYFNGKTKMVDTAGSSLTSSLTLVPLENGNLK